MLGDADKAVENTNKLLPSIVGFLVVSILGFLRCGVITGLALLVPLWGGEGNSSERFDLTGNPPTVDRAVILDRGDPPLPDSLGRIPGATTTDVGLSQGSNRPPVLSALVGSIAPKVQPIAKVKAEKSGEETWDNRLLEYLHSVQWGYVLVTGVICFVIGYLSGWVRRCALQFLHNVKVHTPLPATATDETGVKP